MLLAQLADVSARVAATSSRTAKRDLLAGALAQAPADELAIAVSYLSGTLRQRRTNVGWASLRTPVPPAEAATLTLTEVDARLETVAAQAGAGSAARRTELVTDLLGRATEAEQHLLRGLLFGEIRQGALDSLVQDALAAAFGVPLPVVRRAAMLLGFTSAAAEALIAGGQQALAQVQLRVGQPVRPMLAASSPDVDGALSKAGVPVLVDAKLDGIRVQVHRSGDDVLVFTRSLDDITARVPEIVAAVRALPLRDVVLDGEAIGLDGAGRPLPFQVTASRAATAVPGEPGAPPADSTPTGSAGFDAGGVRGSARRPVPLSLFCFDLLHLDGEDLLDRPLSERARTMSDRLPAELLVPRMLAASAEDVSNFFADTLSRGFEGVVVKKLGAPYAAGRRDSGWIKLKPRHTFDLAVTAAEWGYGRRTGYLSNLHLAARDPVTGGLVMLGKTFKGLTDQMLAWQTEEIQARSSRRTRSVVYADPPLVAEIACDGLQVSTRYPGGVALRFARVVRYRDDKSVDDVDTIDTVRALAPVVSEQAGVEHGAPAEADG
jgi:DNA ligase-1